MKTVGSLSTRERRVVTIGVMIVALALLSGRGAPGWLEWVRSEQNRASRALRQLADAREAVREVGPASDTLAARTARYLALAPALIGGTSAASAGASLAVLVSGGAAAAGLELGALRVTVDSAKEGVFARVSVRGDARGDIRGLTELLLSLERGPVLLAVRQLSISQGDAGAPADRAESLRMDIVVEGLTIDREAVRRADQAPGGSSAPASAGSPR